MVTNSAIPRLRLVTVILLTGYCSASGQDEPDMQPVMVQVRQIRDAMKYLGSPLSQETLGRLDKAWKQDDETEGIKLIEQALDPYCLLHIHINPESRVKVSPGQAPPRLVEQGWRQFLVKVHNEAGITSRVRVQSPQGRRIPGASSQDVKDRWLEVKFYRDRPMSKQLQGLGLEYQILQLYSRDPGKRSAVLKIDVGQGTQDLGFRSDVTIVFDCTPSLPLTFRVFDENGEPTTASFVIRDRQGRIYPSMAKRLAPDFAFQPQIYRRDGEQLNLPQGVYQITVARGPEYLKQTFTIEIIDKPQTAKVRLERWIDPSLRGWWSGDHHIHAAGCAHYTNPTQGVSPSDIYLHCVGEDLKVGAVLTWGPCFDYQKQFFTSREDRVSKYPYLLRYDVEVSGFGSHRSGHLCLLRLKQQIPAGGDSSDHWPTLCLNTLRWAKSQSAVCGPAHSGWGLAVVSDQLPNYEVPPFDGIGANEYIVDVTHMVKNANGLLVPAVDFLSTMDTPPVWELNIWYHTLNCGFRTRISGETDFPCIYGERVGLGRAYVKLEGTLTYDEWCEGVRLGRAYVSDGRSHLFDFQINDIEVGTAESEVRIARPGKVRARASVAAYLPKEPDSAINNRSHRYKPYWHIERARIDGTRDVFVELIVNGYPVDKKRIRADGKVHEAKFEVPIQRSSWLAMRIFPSSHTNPLFVLVDDKAIRASRRSAEWCLKGVDQCWSQKRRHIHKDEMRDAKAAYNHARRAYRRILSECKVE